ncbi:MAG: hypothetical protein ACTHKH_06225 [Trinickia sp.]|jgi:hypothetical protein
MGQRAKASMATVTASASGVGMTTSMRPSIFAVHDGATMYT